MLLDHTQRTQASRPIAACFMLLATSCCLAQSSDAEHASGCRQSPSMCESSLVEIHSFNAQPCRADARWFVVTHGMNGTRTHDRFHQLAETLLSIYPDCRVVIVDWSEASTEKTSWLGLPNPYPVAKRIKSVASQASDQLEKLGFEPGKATLIGESFGNWVNAEIANHQGKVDRIVAMNPASEYGGYSPPDLRPFASVALSFHTYSIFDTLLPVGHRSILLENAEGVSEAEKHTAGIARLATCLRAGDTSWLTLRETDDRSDRNRFAVRAQVDGQLVPCDLPMERPLDPEPQDFSIASSFQSQSVANANP